MASIKMSAINLLLRSHSQQSYHGRNELPPRSFSVSESSDRSHQRVWFILLCASTTAYAPRDVWLRMCIPNSECYPTQHVIHSARCALPTTYADPHNKQAGRQPNPQSDVCAWHTGACIPDSPHCAMRFRDVSRTWCAVPNPNGCNGARTTVTARWDIDLTQQRIGCWRCMYRGFFRRKLCGTGTAFSLKHVI
ncbi:hypothetical protein DFH08DRAFT_805012 [Mycena albidolilacea]|uniref:Uncharacterized protein n=1 Tax=Mycena albidolilacea TaxID=1033008 RepID=A0AAD7ABM2_9AGAR|nr:hypothetical protein DFH08DRAFT_805012 [Mycena albidolilacea]